MTNDALLKACRLEKPSRKPVWFMRQAGRYLQEYMEVRRKKGILEICKEPELAADLSSIPVKKFDLDAAIIFSDITVPILSMGVKLKIEEGRGPVLKQPISSISDVRNIEDFDTSSTDFVYETARLISERLSGRVPVIGFSGAPFTLASYLIEGGSSRDFIRTRTVMFEKSAMWQLLMEKLADMCTGYLEEQFRNGCQVVQLFDSWAGTLSQEEYVSYVKPYNQRIASRLARLGCYVINFATGNPELLPEMACRGVAVVSVDWRIDIGKAMDIVPSVGIQGNLDPALLAADRKIMERYARLILKKTKNRRGHIFNLGHGIPPNAKVENVKALAKLVHNEG
ncbi:MAG: uroporphyrinogen decarboxylase [Methanomassiliicoccales archaeon]